LGLRLSKTRSNIARLFSGERTMRRHILIAALAASLLGACAHHRPHGGGLDPAAPRVFITFKDGLKPAVAVFPDPLYFRKDQTNVRIVWRLPEGLGLKFADNGIVIEGEVTNKPPNNDKTQRGDSKPALFLNKEQNEIVDCRPAEGGLEFSCLYRHTRPGYFKYTIRVLSDGKPLDPLDPSVMGP
jgi:hypothetical protein